MSPIGDTFPPELKAGSFDGQCQPGMVLKTDFIFPDKTKPKRYVVLGVHNGVVGVALINSKINEWAYYSPSQRMYCLEIEHTERGHYLDRDSFVDCTKIYKISEEEVREYFKKGEGQYLGYMSDRDFSDVKGYLRDCGLLTGKDKKRFGLYD